MQKYFLIIVFIVFNNNFAQSLIDLEKIHRNITDNTYEIDHKKGRWIIDDQIELERIFNKLKVETLRKVYKTEADYGFPTTSDLTNFENENSKGNIRARVVQRYSDSQIDTFYFFQKNSSQILFNPIVDGNYLKNKVEDDLYAVILDKNRWPSIDIFIPTNKTAYNFDIKLNLFNPELMFWNTTSEAKNKYLLSFFGKWGNDDIVNPGWYSSDYIGGLKLLYIDDITNTSRNNYSVAIGTSFKGGHPYPEDLPRKITFYSGSSIYLNVTAQPSFVDFIDFSFESKIRLGEYEYEDWLNQETPYPIKDEFYSVNNYYVAKLSFFDLFNKIEAFQSLKSLGNLKITTGISVSDVRNYELDHQDKEVRDYILKNGNQQNSVFIDLGLESNKGLLQFSGSIGLNHNYSAGYTFVTLKFLTMLNNTFGFDVRFAKSVGSSDLPMWRNESYITFSPVIRINY